MNDLMTEFDLYLFNEGKLLEAYKHFGSHIIKDDLNRVMGVRFTVYAPHAKIVSVVVILTTGIQEFM